MTQLPTTNMVNTDQSDNSVALTVGSKAGVSVDPRVTGYNIGEDELALSSIYSRPTLLPPVAWAQTDAAGTILTTLPVCPFVGTTSPLDYVGMTALGFCAVPFSQWSGSLVFRIQIVCSKYHRGRLRFDWNPDSNYNNDMTRVFNHIVDIADTKELCFTVPYARDRPVLDTGLPQSFGAYADTNGFFTIRVQNELTAPDSVTDVAILVWVSGGPDLTFYNPRHQFAKYQVHRHSMEMKDTNVCEEVVFFTGGRSPHYDELMYGDPIRSFRPLLKRYTLHTCINRNDGLPANGRRFVYNVPQYPQAHGPSIYGTSYVTADSLAYNMTLTHLANFLEFSFLIKRGGFRWIADTRLLGNEAVSTNARITRQFNTATMAAFQFRGDTDSSFAPTTYALGQGGYNVLGGNVGSSSTQWATETFSGSQLYMPHRGQLPTWEVPFYNSKRYVNNLTPNTTSATTSSIPEQAVRLVLDCYNEGTALPYYANSPVELYCAAADDFTMNFFLGVPLWSTYDDRVIGDFSTGYAPLI
jgi:hypothetical protein